MITEQTIILAIIGMVGLFSSAFVWQRANRITGKYYEGIGNGNVLLGKSYIESTTDNQAD